MATKKSGSSFSGEKSLKTFCLRSRNSRLRTIGTYRYARSSLRDHSRVKERHNVRGCDVPGVLRDLPLASLISFLYDMEWDPYGGTVLQIRLRRLLKKLIARLIYEDWLPCGVSGGYMSDRREAEALRTRGYGRAAAVTEADASQSSQLREPYIVLQESTCAEGMAPVASQTRGLGAESQSCVIPIAENKESLRMMSL